jgi:hypothetical protein
MRTIPNIIIECSCVLKLRAILQGFGGYHAHIDEPNHPEDILEASFGMEESFLFPMFFL